MTNKDNKDHDSLTCLFVVLILCLCIPLIVWLVQAVVAFIAVMVPYLAWIGSLGAIWLAVFYILARYDINSLDTSYRNLSAFAATVGAIILASEVFVGLPTEIRTVPVITGLTIATIVAAIGLGVYLPLRMRSSVHTRIKQLLRRGEVGDALRLWANARNRGACGDTDDPFEKVLPHQPIRSALESAAIGVAELGAKLQAAETAGIPRLLENTDVEMIARAISAQADRLATACLLRSGTEREEELLREEVGRIERIIDAMNQTRETLVHYVLAGTNLPETEQVLRDNVKLLRELVDVRTDVTMQRGPDVRAQSDATHTTHQTQLTNPNS